MDYLYSLYDALVSIAVPNDRARAVVDAMETDMSTTLATKDDVDRLRTATKDGLEKLQSATSADLEKLRSATRADMEQLRSATSADLETFRLSTTAELKSLRELIHAEVGTLRVELRISGRKRGSRGISGSTNRP